MTKINNYYQFSYVFAVCVIPISLLISSGVSEVIVIIISTYFFLNFEYVKKKIYNNVYFYLLLILWFYLILNYFTSLNSNLSFLRNILFFKYIAYIFSLFFLLEKKAFFNRIFLVWLISTLIVSLDIFFEYFNGKNILGFESYDPSRIASFLGNELKIAHFLYGFSFISLGYFIDKFNQKRFYYHEAFILLLIGLFTAAIVMTGERANTIKFIMGIIIFIALLSNRFFKYKKIKLFLILVILFSLYIFSAKLKERSDTILLPLKENGFFNYLKKTQHGAHYYTALEIFKKYPWFGIGNKNFREECSNNNYYNKDYLYTDQRCATHPHQIYFELLSEHGLLGSTVILSIIFYSIFKGIKTYRRDKNTIHLGSIVFIATQFLPIVPSGSFFTSWGAIIFWTNFAILIFYNCKAKNAY
jgi:O-antigen ligase